MDKELVYCFPGQARFRNPAYPGSRLSTWCQMVWQCHAPGSNPYLHPSSFHGRWLDPSIC
eukprot:6704164-Pyramimonas_sp.AAC.1